MKRPSVHRPVKARATAAKRHVKAACWCIRSRGRPERLWSKRKRRSACLSLLSLHRCFYTRMFGGTCQRPWLTCTTNYTRGSFVRVWARSCICVLRVRGLFAPVQKKSQSSSALGGKKRKTPISRPSVNARSAKFTMFKVYVNAQRHWQLPIQLRRGLLTQSSRQIF